MASSQSGRPRVTDSPTFLLAALVVTVIVVAGFARSWFLRPLLDPQASLSPLVQLHGALMSVWAALFVVQIALVAAGRTDLHRRLGRVGGAVLLLIVATGVPLVLTAARLGGDHMPGPPVPALAFVAGFLITFAVLAGAALLSVRRPEVHKRLMCVAAVTAMEAAVVRLPFVAGPLAGHAVTDAVLLLVVGVDTLRHRRLHPAFVVGGLFLVGMQALVLGVAGTSAWAALARYLIGA